MICAKYRGKNTGRQSVNTPGHEVVILKSQFIGLCQQSNAMCCSVIVWYDNVL
jgi:hypothetical protein